MALTIAILSPSLIFAEQAFDRLTKGKRYKRTREKLVNAYIYQKQNVEGS